MSGTHSHARFLRRTALCLTTILASGLATPAWSQSTPPPPETYRNDDEHGVDLVTGTLNRTILEGSIGSGSEGIKLYRHWTKAGSNNNWDGELTVTGTAGSQTATLVFGNISEKFTESGGGWVNVKANGATLTGSAGAGFTYRTASGATVEYTPVASLATELATPMSALQLNAWTGPCSEGLRCALPTRITDPDGSRYSLTWKVPSQCTQDGDPQAPIDENTTFTCTVSKRLTDVRSRTSHALKFKYQSDQWPAANPANEFQWSTRTGARFYDLSQVYCDAADDNCDTVTHAAQASYAYPSANVTQVTDEQGGQWTFTTNTARRLTAIRRPGATSDTTTVTYDASLRVTSITDDGVTKGYVWTTGSTNTVATTVAGTSTGSTGSTNAYGQPTSSTDAYGQTTQYTYDGNARLTRVTAPEGNYANFTRDTRGNIIEQRLVAKPGSGLADIVTSANYDTTCANPVTCNKPNYTIDALNNRTDYTYNSSTGELERIQLPAATTGGIRPQVDYGYTSLYPQVKNVAGTLVNADAPEVKLTQVTTCATAATCAGTANETKVTYAYNTPNLLLTSVTVASGDGSLSSTTAYTYDAADNLKTIDGPLPGSDDTTTHFYDTGNRRRGTIGPDPDGTGTRQRPAVRYTFNAESQVTREERGWATAATDAALDAMTVSEFTDYGYNANGDLVTQMLKSGTATYSVNQFTYLTNGLLDCAALRMNPATFASLPTSACTAADPSTTFGPDRIVKYGYDNNLRTSSVTSAFGLTEATTENLGYTNNGKLDWVRDGENNRTAYQYDGHDRLYRTYLPVTTQGANAASASDFEQLAYDANGNVIQRTLRGGGTIGFEFDNLGRVKTITPSAGGFNTTISYDLLGRTIERKLTVANQTETFNWNALGQLKTEGQVWGNASYDYDVAGRMTKLTWADGFYVNYDYDLLGNVTAIRENGATSGVGVLATYTYDSLGRRDLITRGNGSITDYDWDPVSRLSSLTQNLYDTTNDLTINGFVYNPAGQITEQTRSNPLYSWDGHYNLNRNATVNGLNQTTQSGDYALGHDARGNVTSSTINSVGSNYTYDQANRLTTGPNGYGQSYDPSGRLLKFGTGGTTTVKLVYAGSAIVSELNSANVMQRRYVPGPGMDEPLAWYEGSGTSDRRWYHADERGSIVATSGVSGAMLAINRYDEYGVPRTSSNPSYNNTGRFQYTGQAWLPQLGMYHYKARTYSPTLGRFMQTDPIGYRDGMNWYNYVGGDPVNFRDPRGLDEDPIIVTGEKKEENEPYQSGYDAGGMFSSFIFNIVYDLIPVEEIVVTAPRIYNRPRGGGERGPCISMKDGPVNIYGGGFSFVLIAGGSFTAAYFEIPSTGATGWVTAGGGHAGLEGFVGGIAGSYDTMGDLLGVGWQVTVEVPGVPGFGLGAYSSTLTGDVTGNFGSLGVGGGGSLGRVGTRLKSSSIPLC